MIPKPGTCLVCEQPTAEALYCSNCKNSPRALNQVKVFAESLMDPEQMHEEIKDLIEMVKERDAELSKLNLQLSEEKAKFKTFYHATVKAETEIFAKLDESNRLNDDYLRRLKICADAMDEFCNALEKADGKNPETVKAVAYWRQRFGEFRVGLDEKQQSEKRKCVGPSDVDPMERTMPVITNPTHGGCGCTTTVMCRQHQKGE